MCLITYHLNTILRPKRPKILTNAKYICVLVSMTVQERILHKTDPNHIKTSMRREKVKQGQARDPRSLRKAQIIQISPHSLMIWQEWPLVILLRNLQKWSLHFSNLAKVVLEGIYGSLSQKRSLIFQNMARSTLGWNLISWQKQSLEYQIVTLGP